MGLTAYLVGAGLTKSLELTRRVPLMMDFVRVLTEYVHNNVVLNTLVVMELGQVYETACKECKQLAKEIDRVTPSSAKAEQRNQFAALVKGRQPESIETLFERAVSDPPNAYSSGLPIYFQYAINQVFSIIGWDLQLNLLTRFLAKQFEDDRRKHVFVSFNYDLALDRAVQIASRELWQPWDGYGFPFPFYITADSPPTQHAIASPCSELPRGSSRFRILKPHGSLNWLGPIKRHPAPSVSSAADDMVLPLDADWQLRYWCNANVFNDIAGTSEWPRNYGILISPPTAAKTAIVQQTLDHEVAAIREADEIFVIGYSIPKTDQHQRNLIREAVLGRTSPINSLIVVNYNAPAEYFKDTRELFRPLSMQTFNSGFADFAEAA